MRKNKSDEKERITGDDMLNELSELDYEDDLQLLDDEDMTFSDINDSDYEDDDTTFGDFYDEDFVSDNSSDDFSFDEDFDIDPFEGLEISDYSDEEVADEVEDDVTIPDVIEEPKTKVNDTSNIDSYLNGILEAKKDLEQSYQPLESTTSIEEKTPVVETPKIESREDVKTNNQDFQPFESYQSVQGNGEIASLEPSDINLLFDRVSTNVKEASSIFSRNLEMKKKIDERFEELKKLQSEHEKNKKIDYDEINSYKDEVYLKLKDKKAEVEKKLNELKDLQAKFDQEKAEFEKYKSETLIRLKDAEREQTLAYNERKEEITKLEDKLIKKKDAIDEEKRQLKLDRIQYETEKNTLATNLVKFNELVGDFTVGIDRFNSSNND